MARHGETEANRQRLIQGRNDTPLTDDGIRGIATVADKLAALVPDPATLICYSSPLPRALDTLRRLRQRLGWSGPVATDERIREIDFGDYTGRPVDEILPFIQHHKENSSLRYPNGESGDDLATRVMGFLDQLRADYPDRTVLVVSHFGPIETALRRYRHIPVSQRVWPAHDQVHRFVFGENRAPEVTTF